jgi:hypothetical protein
MKQLSDFVPYRLTNSDDKYKFLDKILKSASTDDGKAIVAAIAILIDEVIKLQELIPEAPE